MKTLAWLLLSGVLWLLLIQVAAELAVPPQLISMARSLYLGTFAIFMMMEIRSRSAQENTAVPALNATNIVWYSVPALSVLVLWLLSPELRMTGHLWIVIGGFYLMQLLLLALRSARSGMRSGAWELMVPFLLLPLLLHEALAIGAIVFGALMMLWHIRTSPPPDYSSERPVVDALIMQLPSLCIAPVALILLRDVIGANSTLERANMEILGMIVNGVGSALWTTAVMRKVRLISASIMLWGLASAIALTLDLVLDAASITYVICAMLLTEVLRGSVWLGLTQLLTDSSRWRGFALNAVATAFPLATLLSAHHLFSAQRFILFYAACHVLVPLSLWSLRCDPHMKTK